MKISQMKIIFLDIDGVLNSRKSLANFKSLWQLSPDNISQLNRIIDATNAKIVISSSWRYCKEISSELESYLNNDCGIKGEIIGRTPVIGFSRRRGCEIATWVEEWQGETIESFVILDDGSDMEPFMDRLCQTSFEVGLTEKDADKAIKMLNDHS